MTKATETVVSIPESVALEAPSRSGHRVYISSGSRDNVELNLYQLLEAYDAAEALSRKVLARHRAELLNKPRS